MTDLDADFVWPLETYPLSREEAGELAERLGPAFFDKIRELRLPACFAESVRRVYLPLAAWARRQKPAGRPLVLGLNGAQGSGKSTLCEFLKLILREGFGFRVAGFSIDDLYLTRAERERLARDAHPLLAVRGVPGTHDVALGSSVLDALLDPAGGPVALPSFDKAVDEGRPASDWPVFEGPADIVIFEGWCVGAKPQADAELAAPINTLEREEDPHGVWRGYVNRQLEGPYAELFGRLDRLICLKAPDLECVYNWRRLQEQKLAATARPGTGPHRLMDERQLRRFVMFYERLTRHGWVEMPARADLTLYLNPNHRFTSILIKH